MSFGYMCLGRFGLDITRSDTEDAVFANTPQWLTFFFSPLSVKESQRELTTLAQYRDKSVTCTLAEKLSVALAVFSQRGSTRADAHCALLDKLFNMVRTHMFVTARMHLIAHCTNYSPTISSVFSVQLFVFNQRPFRMEALVSHPCR